MSLEFLQIGGEPQAEACVIWLHGLGADGHDFEPVVDALKLPAIRFILPHAPVRAVSLNQGYRMPAWFDLFGLESGSRQDAVGIAHAQAQLEALIAQQIADGIQPQRIVLAGFSQGGALALHTAIRYPQRLAGVLALSTYLPLAGQIAEQHIANRSMPIFMAHGDDDEIIRLPTAQAAADLLRQHGYTLEWHTYPMAHSLCLQEIADIRRFLLEVLPDRTD